MKNDIVCFINSFCCADCFLFIFFVYRISLKVSWYIFQFAMTDNIYQTKHVFHVKIVVRTLHRAIKWQGDVMLDAVITGLENIVKVGMDYFNHILDFFIPFSWFRFDCFLQTKNNLTIKLIYNAYNHVKYNFPQKLYIFGSQRLRNRVYN